MQLMNIIDHEFFDKPFYGVRRMTHHLRLMGYRVKEKPTHKKKHETKRMQCLTPLQTNRNYSGTNQGKH
jgi:hypothetical protein